MTLSLFIVTALQCHYEVHQPASSAAQCAHAQPHRKCAQLDGFLARLLPWTTGLLFHPLYFMFPEEIEILLNLQDRSVIYMLGKCFQHKAIGSHLGYKEKSTKK